MNQENGTVIASARGRVAPLIVALAALEPGVVWLPFPAPPESPLAKRELP
jgi:hypothetical protein